MKPLSESPPLGTGGSCSDDVTFACAPVASAMPRPISARPRVRSFGTGGGGIRRSATNGPRVRRRAGSRAWLHLAVGLVAIGAVSVAAIGIGIGSPDLRWITAGRHVPSFDPVSSEWLAGFEPVTAGIVAIVLFLAGVVSGLSGFAFSAVAAFVLWLLPPMQAVPLIMMLSVCNQFLSIGALRGQMLLVGTPTHDGALPYIAGGIAGVPFGVELLRILPSTMAAGGLGVFLVTYSVLSLLKPDSLRIKMSGWKPAVAIGAAGGIVGGFSAFPGSIPVVYLGLRGVGKAETRGVAQPYILALQLVSLSILALTNAAIFNARFWLLWAFALPAVLLGSCTGVALYRRMSDVDFRRAMLVLLAFSGLSLVARATIRASAP